MTNAPERIWLQDGGDYSIAHEVTWCVAPVDEADTAYIRADLVDGHDAAWAERVALLEAAVAAARAEGWNAAIDAAADEAEEHKHFAKGIECCGDCIRKMKRAAA